MTLEKKADLMDLRARRDAAALRVKQASPHEAEAVYRQEYVPAAAAYLAAQGQPTEVLVATVGTQPYSVALSLAYSPARCVYLIHTDDSAKSADEALTLCAQPPAEVRRRPVGKADSVAVYREIRAAVEEHRDQSIVIDFTSGTKAMTAAASTVAGHLRLRQVYIESTKLRDTPLLFGNEVPHVVEHPLLVLGDPQREEAERFFDAGRFDVALRLFDDLRLVNCPGYCFEARVRLCRGYLHWDGLRFTNAVRELSEAAEALERGARANLSRECLLDQVDRLRAQVERAKQLASATAKDARTAHDPVLANALMRYLVSAARRREKTEPDLASLLLYRTLELALQRRLAVHGLDASDFSPPDPASLLARYNERVPPRHRLTEWPKKLALAQCRSVLAALGDAPLEALLEGTPVERFNGLLDSRNASIYAHGFRCLSATDKDWVDFRDQVLGWAEAVALADNLDLPRPDPEFDFVELSQYRDRSA